MRRGDTVLVTLQGDYAKPRPAIVVQADVFNDDHASITVLPLTSHIVDAPDFRITVDPAAENGLSRVSQIMIDKIVSVRRRKIRQRLGSMGAATMTRIDRALAVWVGIA